MTTTPNNPDAAPGKARGAPLDLEQFSGFTPGPFTSPGADGDARVICHHNDRRRRTLAHVYGARQEATARLFAAAPDLLAECRRQRDEIARLRADPDTLDAQGDAQGEDTCRHCGADIAWSPMRVDGTNKCHREGRCSCRRWVQTEQGSDWILSEQCA